MKKLSNYCLLYYCIFLFLSCNSAFCQKERLSLDEQKEEVRLLKKKLNLIHPSLYRFCKKSQLDSIFNGIETKIVKEQSPQEFGKLLMPVFLAIKDAHTWPRVPQSKKQLKKVIPIEVKVISGKLFVYKNYSSDSTLFEGSEIVEINQVSSQQILFELKRNVIVDGNIETTKERVVEEWFQHFYFDQYGYLDFFSVKILFSENNLIVKNIKALTMEEFGLKVKNNMSHPSKSKLSPPFYSLKKYDRPKAAVIKLSWFEKIPWGEYTKFIDSCFVEIERRQIDNLIIDLRWNMGGAREYPIYLYSKISETPFTYCKELITTSETVKEKIPFDSIKVFEKIEENFYLVRSDARGLGVQIPSKNPFRGKVFLLIDGQSNSSSAQFASIFFKFKRGKIIGEEPGGLYSGGTGEHHYYLKLPYSKIIVQIPRYRIVLDVDQSEFYRHGVKPDFEVKEDIKDIIEGEDTILEFTLDLMR